MLYAAMPVVGGCTEVANRSESQVLTPDPILPIVGEYSSGLKNLLVHVCSSYYSINNDRSPIASNMDMSCPTRAHVTVPKSESYPIGNLYSLLFSPLPTFCMDPALWSFYNRKSI